MSDSFLSGKVFAKSGKLHTTLVYDAGGRQVDVHFGVPNAAALETQLARLRTGR